MAKKTIKIKCSASGLAKIDELVPSQGNLKTLSKANYEKLRGLIVKHGFSVPVFVWKNGGKMNILDGHQRKATLTKMRDDEGYEIPEIPYAEIKADSRAEAMEKLLAIASQFGKIDRQGLYEFAHDQEIDLGFLKAEIDLPDLNMASWAAEFYETADAEADQGKGKGSKELDEGDFGATTKVATCPECKHQFKIPK